MARWYIGVHSAFPGHICREASKQLSTSQGSSRTTNGTYAVDLHSPEGWHCGFARNLVHPQIVREEGAPHKEERIDEQEDVSADYQEAVDARWKAGVWCHCWHTFRERCSQSDDNMT